jgi:hypothetical protein
MIERIKKNLEDGVDKVKWYSSILSERLKVESSVIRLMRESADLQKKRDGLLKDIGTRVFELKSSPELNLMEDRALAAIIKDIDALDEDIETLNSRADMVQEPEEPQE